MAEKEQEKNGRVTGTASGDSYSGNKDPIRLEKGDVHSYRIRSFPRDLLYAVMAGCIDPGANILHFSKGKGAIALFLLAGIWWIFEVVPIGVTALAIGVFQALFAIRSAKDAFKDFMDPSVMFIFASVVVGLAFTKSGLTKRLAYKMLQVVGEKTNMIVLGALVVTAGLAHVMAHTAAAATVFPILLAINSLYGEGDKPTKFGKSLFIGMAYAAGAGSVITFLGSARAAAGAGMFQEFTGKTVGFFELSKFAFPIGWVMVFLIWIYLMVFLKPEKSVIPGVKRKGHKTRERNSDP